MPSVCDGLGSVGPSRCDFCRPENGDTPYRGCALESCFVTVGEPVNTVDSPVVFAANGSAWYF